MLRQFVWAVVVVASFASASVVASFAQGVLFDARSVEGKEPRLLGLASVAVTVDVVDRLARITLDQSFANRGTVDAEGLYVLKLPEGATLARVATWEAGELAEGYVEERKKARYIYDRITGRKRDPVLIEWAGKNRFEMSVYPIPALGTKRVLVAYDVVVPARDDEVVLPVLEGPGRWRGPAVGEVSFQASVRDSHGVATPVLDGLRATVTGGPQSWVLSAKARGVTLEQGLTLRWQEPRPEATTLSLVARRTEGKDGFFLLRARFDRRAAARHAQASVAVLLDGSRSMDFDNCLPDAIKTVGQFLGGLREDDEFRCFVARDALVPLDSTWRRGVAADVARTQSLLAGVQPCGTFDPTKAIEAAAKALAQRNGVRYLLVVTDDRNQVSEEARQRLVALLKDEKIQPLIVTRSTSVKEYGQLRRFALQRGERVVLVNEGDVAAQLREWTNLIALPGMKGIYVEWGAPGIWGVAPRTIPYLASGGEALFFGRYAVPGKLRVALGCRSGTHETVADFDLPAARDADVLVERSWAQRFVDRLLEASALPGADAPELTTEIVSQAKEYKLVTPLTSFIAIPPSVRRKNQAEFDRADATWNEKNAYDTLEYSYGGDFKTLANIESLTTEFADELALLNVKVTTLEGTTQEFKKDLEGMERRLRVVEGRARPARPAFVGREVDAAALDRRVTQALGGQSTLEAALRNLAVAAARALTPPRSQGPLTIHWAVPDPLVASEDDLPRLFVSASATAGVGLDVTALGAERRDVRQLAPCLFDDLPAPADGTRGSLALEASLRGVAASTKLRFEVPLFTFAPVRPSFPSPRGYAKAAQEALLLGDDALAVAAARQSDLIGRLTTLSLRFSRRDLPERGAIAVEVKVNAPSLAAFTLAATSHDRAWSLDDCALAWSVEGVKTLPAGRTQVVQYPDLEPAARGFVSLVAMRTGGKGWSGVAQPLRDAPTAAGLPAHASAQGPRDAFSLDALARELVGRTEACDRALRYLEGLIGRR